MPGEFYCKSCMSRSSIKCKTMTIAYKPFIFESLCIKNYTKYNNNYYNNYMIISRKLITLHIKCDKYNISYDNLYPILNYLYTNNLII